MFFRYYSPPSRRVNNCARTIAVFASETPPLAFTSTTRIPSLSQAASGGMGGCRGALWLRRDAPSVGTYGECRGALGLRRGAPSVGTYGECRGALGLRRSAP